MRFEIVVNDQPFSLVEAIRRDMMHENTLISSAIEEVVVRQYALEQGIENSDEELQMAADEMRYARGLESAEEALEWIKKNGQTLLSIQNSLDYQLIRNKIRSRIEDEEAAAYFVERQLEFVRLELYSIRVESKDIANELLAQIKEENKDFHVLAREHSQDAGSASQGGFVGFLTRAEMTPDIESAVFGAEQDEVIGPLQTKKGWNIFKVGKRIGLEMDDYKKERIKDLLFDELVTKLKVDAKVEYPFLEESESEGDEEV